MLRLDDWHRETPWVRTSTVRRRLLRRSPRTERCDRRCTVRLRACHGAACRSVKLINPQTRRVKSATLRSPFARCATSPAERLCPDSAPGDKRRQAEEDEVPEGVSPLAPDDAHGRRAGHEQHEAE